MKQYTLYFHVNTVKQEVFYVGIGKGRRPYTKRLKNSHWLNIVNKYNYDVIVIHKNLTKKQAEALEIKYISQIGRSDLNEGTLVNKTSGGEGTNGYSHTKAWKKKKSKEQEGIWTKQKRKNHSNTIKATFKKNSSGKKSLKSRIKNNTLKRSDETKQKAKANTTNLWKNPEYRKKVLDARQKAYKEGRGKRKGSLLTAEEQRIRAEINKKKKSDRRKAKRANMSIDQLKEHRKIKYAKAKERRANRKNKL